MANHGIITAGAASILKCGVNLSKFEFRSVSDEYREFDGAIVIMKNWGQIKSSLS